MKHLSFILLALLLVCLILPAQAVSGSERLSFTDSGQCRIPVHASVIETTAESGTVYSVDLTWGDLSFQYQRTKNLTWDPTLPEPDYVVSYSDGKWVTPTVMEGASIQSNQIRIKNLSNEKVAYTLTYEPLNDTFASVTGNFYCMRSNDVELNFNERIPLNSPAGNNRYTEDTVDFSLTGDLPNSVSGEDFEVGGITVKIYPYQG